MKKLIALFALSLSLFTISCSKDDDAPAQNVFVKKWYFVSETQIITKTKVGASKLALPQKSVLFVEFKTNGTYTTGGQYGETISLDETGTYTKTNDQINFKPNDMEAYSASITKYTDSELIFVKRNATKVYTNDINNAAAFY